MSPIYRESENSQPIVKFSQQQVDQKRSNQNREAQDRVPYRLENPT